MAQREYRFYVNEPLNPEDEEDEEEEGDDEEDEDEQIDVDNPDEDANDNGIENDNGHVDDASEDGSSGLDTPPLHVLFPNPQRQPKEEDDDDAMTWESLSTISEQDQLPETDEWYPLMERKTVFPNFALPTTTRPAFNMLQQIDTRETRSRSPDEDDSGSEKDDTEFQEFEDVMRPDPTQRDLAEMVLDYFLHHGHSEVVETYCKEMNLPIPEEDIRAMKVRNDVKQSILEGRMEEALEKMNAISPDIIKDDLAHFEFRKQHMIEMIRGGLTKEPVEYFREHLMPGGVRPVDERMELLERIFTLMVFSQEDKTKFHVFYEQKERVKTANVINSAILGVMKKPRFSRIDMLAKGMVWMQTELTNSQTHHHKTTEEWAERFFGTPYGFDDLIHAVVKREPLDFTKEFS